MRTVAVLGGGPAGSLAARQLAEAGARTILFDEKMAWEKPCGGGVTYKAYQQYPYLADSLTPKRDVRSTWLHAPGAKSVSLCLQHPLLIYSRRVLNQLLLDRAAAAGASLEQSRVLGMERNGTGWSVRTAKHSISADFVIVATGARNPLREVGTIWRAEDTMHALGYYVESQQPHIDIQFFKQFEGYIWIFPRAGHLSVGICGKGEPAQKLRQRLERFMDSRGLPYLNARFYAHMLPGLESSSWARNRIAGDGWLAVGDAAGLVDPITGEGIYYALRSGDLAGTLVAQGREAEYRALLDAEFTRDLAYGSTLAKRVFLGRFLFSPNTSRMLQFLRRSPRLHDLMQGLFAGTIGYHELRHQIRGHFRSTMAEIALNVFLRRMVTPEEAALN